MSTRYRDKRQLINWRLNPSLQVTKQLAGAVKRFEACGKFELWNRVTILLPSILETVLGVYGMTFEKLRDQTRAEQNRVINPNRLWGRADVVLREGYKETDEFTVPVVDAYLAITKGTVDLDPRRNFTDDEVRTAMIRQKSICGNPACRAPFTPLNPPVGDHAMPHSRGGRTTQDNCIALCQRCNSQKGDLDFQEFIAKHSMNNARGRKRLVS